MRTSASRTYQPQKKGAVGKSTCPLFVWSFMCFRSYLGLQPDSRVWDPGANEPGPILSLVVLAGPVLVRSQFESGRASW